MKKIKTILLLVIFLSATNIAAAQTINVNTATAKEITQIKGIGRVKAVAIVEHCQTKTPCVKASDLLSVKGIGAKTLDKIKDKISFDINN